MSSAHDTSGLTRQRYQRIVYGLVAVGIVGLVAGIAFDAHLAGTVIYLLGAWAGAGIAYGAPRLTDATLQDERDRELHNVASGLTMGVSMTLGIGIIPALYVLDAGGYVTLDGAPGGVVLTLSALYLLYGVCHGIAKRRV